ncbi:MAG TPA: hypothetical protein VJ909_00515 [Prolixibacteraceae bacterium]|nr:hypothetical protein [Prolixibacteraceae bacterium]
MTTLKLTLNEKSGKGKQLLDLLSEMAKNDDSIQVEDINEPNEETRKAMKDAEDGKVTKIENIDELFNSI